jgi:DNA replicative helicase MCM subunit Mcm2 (Cdc46/Mcm family)
MPSEYLKCVDCGNEFEHTERDQEFYQERGFTPPKRCRSCRTKKKARFDKGGGESRGEYRRDDEGY